MAPAKLIPLLTILMCLGIGFASFAIYTGLKNQPVVQDVATPFPSETPQETFLVFDFPTSSESSTPTVTPSPRPTPTQIDYGDMPITQTATTLLVIANTAQAGIVQVNQTQSALDDAKTREAAANSAISTAYAMAAATDDERVRVDHANAEYNLSLQKARDNLSLTFDYIWKIGGSILLILALILGMLFVYYQIQLQAHRKAVETISDNFLENIQAPVVQTSLDTHSGAEHPISMTTAEIVSLKRAVVELKGILSRRKIILGEYFTGTRWRQLDDELVNKDANDVAFFETLPSGAITPTDAGWKWLKLTPPTSPPVQKPAENSQERQITQPIPTRPTSAHSTD